MTGASSWSRRQLFEELAPDTNDTTLEAARPNLINPLGRPLKDWIVR